MATPNSLLITQLYVGYYNRAPDPEGLDYWVGRYNAGMTLIEIANSFSVQVESTTTYPWLNSRNLDAGLDQFITQVYQNLFERAPDADGLAYWKDQLLGGKPPGRFILDVISGAQGDDKTIIERKTEVANYYTDQAILEGVTWTVEDDLAGAAGALDGDRTAWLAADAVATAKVHVDGIIVAEVAPAQPLQQPPSSQELPVFPEQPATQPPSVPTVTAEQPATQSPPASSMPEVTVEQPDTQSSLAAINAATLLTTETDIEFTTTGTHEPALSGFGIANVTFSNNATFSLGKTDDLHTINVASSSHRISLIDMDSSVTTINVTGLQAPGAPGGPGTARHDFWYVDGDTLTMNWTSDVAEDPDAGELYFRDIGTVTFNYSGPFDTRFIDSTPDGDDSVFQFDDSLLNLTINNKGAGDMYLLGASDDEAIAATQCLRSLAINATNGDLAVSGDVDTIVNLRNLTLSAAGGNYLALDDIGSPDDDINGGTGIGERLEIVNVTTGSNSDIFVTDLRADRSSISTFDVTAGNDGKIIFDDIFAQDISEMNVTVAEESFFDVDDFNFVNRGDNLVVKGAGETGDWHFTDEAFANMDFSGMTVFGIDVTFCGAEFGSKLTTTSFADVIESSADSDDINSGLGDDNVDSNAGNDVITDTGGTNLIRGDRGLDTVNIAGPGADVVAIGHEGPTNFDTINGFDIATDRLRLGLDDMGGDAVDGNGNLLTLDANPILQTITSSTVINGASEIFIVEGAFATLGAVENAINYSGSRAILAAALGGTPDVGDQLVVSWTDTLGNTHVSAAEITNEVVVAPGVEGYNFHLNEMAVVNGVPALATNNFEFGVGELGFLIARTAPADGSISEEAGESATFTITLAGDALIDFDGAASVKVNVGGSATDMLDLTMTVYQAIQDAIAALGPDPGVAFNSGTGMLTFEGGGPTSLSFTMTAADDSDVEGTESLVVTLSDAAVDGGCDTATVIAGVASVSIEETDVKNAAPVIASGSTGSVAENAPASTVVYDTEATDADLDPLTYAFGGGVDDALFNIDPNTGEVTFKVSPDFEAPGDSGGDNVYDIVVQASDGSLATTKAVAITVTNVNVAPVITSGSTGSVAENAPASTVVYDTNATDDGENTNTLTYAFGGGVDDALFNIDSNTGEVTFKVSPDFEAPGDSGGDNVYDIVVQASDGSLAITKAVAITVTNVADADPCDQDDAGAALPVNLNGTNGNDVMKGTAGNDNLDGNNGNDTIYGAAGNDTISGNNDSDVLYGQAGNDIINGVNNNDTIYGGSGNDTIDGGLGNDFICGGSGNDSIVANDGDDTVRGGYGIDTINLGNNDNDTDIVLFSSVLDFGDTVSDFEVGDDLVHFNDSLNAEYDDLINNNNFAFATGNGADGGTTAANLNTVEALLLGGTGGEGVSTADLGNAALVAAEFNSEFTITAGVGQDALLVVNDTSGNSFALWQYVEAGGAEMQASEVTLIGIFSADGNATTANFDFS